MATQKRTLNLAITGHVDHGKSTLVGRLFYECGQIPPRVFERLTRHAEALKRPELRFAFWSDRKLDERQRGISIESAYHGFEHESTRFNVIDVPGHRDFIKNAISGLVSADAAILVVDAKHTSTHGVAPQTKEAIVLLTAFGVSPILVAINKMDSVDFSPDTFELTKLEIENHFLQHCPIGNQLGPFIPVSAVQGDNVTQRSDSMSWFSGDTLLDAIAQIPLPSHSVDRPFRMPILRTFSVRGVGTVITGKIEAGSVAVGDRVVIVPYPEQGSVGGEVKSIESHHDQVQSAQAGDDVGIVLAKEDKHFVARLAKKGAVVSAPSQLPPVMNRFLAEIRVIDHPSGVGPGYAPMLHIHQAAMPCRISEVVSVSEHDFESCSEAAPRRISNGQSGLVWVETDRPLVVELVNEYPSLGRLVLRDGRTVAMGFCCGRGEVT